MKNRLKYYILAFYFLTIGSYFNFAYPWFSSMILIVIIIPLLKIKYSLRPRNLFFAAGLLLLYVMSSISSDGSFTPLKYAIVIPLLPLIQKVEILRIYHMFKILFLYSMIPSILVLILYVLGVQEILPSYVIDVGRSFIVYPGTVVQEKELLRIGFFTFYRVSGILGEPGGVGTVAWLILLIERCNFKILRNRLILYTGLISFSLAFYVLFSLTFLFFLLYEKKEKLFDRKLLTVLAFLIILGGTSLFDSLIASRFTKLDKTESIELQLRARATTEDFFKFFLRQDYISIFLGRGNDVSNEEIGGVNFGVTYMSYLYLYGVANAILMFWLIYSIFRIYLPGKESFIFLLLILASFYQRPYIFNGNYFFLFFCIAYSSINKFICYKRVNIRYRRCVRM
ncbi:hypothetical protein [uncultured Sanguibacteroides sp.]|uniref:hypothetical protein n=1 Tax=uncultured Sanguibacteroides sp. TaxID=1635151 RepID=UPI0025DF196E|nr:hypothetical protein [uncultured Sanguibacteroides sp.]